MEMIEIRILNDAYWSPGALWEVRRDTNVIRVRIADNATKQVYGQWSLISKPEKMDRCNLAGMMKLERDPNDDAKRALYSVIQ
ncbi:hypothetical protein FRC06_010620, partial [Ceratobasidium sp. 370]